MNEASRSIRRRHLVVLAVVLFLIVLSCYVAESTLVIYRCYAIQRLALIWLLPGGLVYVILTGDVHGGMYTTLRPICHVGVSWAFWFYLSRGIIHLVSWARARRGLEKSQLPRR